MEVIEKWIAEFFIRRQSNPRVSSSNLLLALKLGDDSSDSLKLKISSVLGDISNSLIRGSVDEGTLELLEILEKLLLEQHSILVESHKSAYCWTAIECTIQFMWPLSASEGLFADALERIWTKRIGILKASESDLVTQELLKWESDLKKALKDPELYQRIRESNIRYTAISFLTQLLQEQWALLGSSYIESVALKSFRKRKTHNVEEPNAVDDNMRRLESDTDVFDKEEENGNSRENGNDEVEGVGCVENDVTEKVNVTEEEVQTMGGQDEEHQPKLDDGEKLADRQLKDYLLEIHGQIDPSTRQGQESNNVTDQFVDVSPQPAQVNNSGTGNHNESSQQKGLDSQGTWSGRTRRRLPTSLSPDASPLKRESSSHSRRQKRFWTPEEVEALKEGVKEYGKSWRDIKNANPAVFKERTEVDLKDKWRNLYR